VLLHGFTGDSTTWAHLGSELGDERPVHGIDLVGHGRSEAPVAAAAYTIASTIRSVVRAVSDLGSALPESAPLAPGPVPSSHWLGYSMGGRVALSLALAEPGAVASLVLVGASPGLADPVARAARVAADTTLADAVERDGLEAFVDQWMRHPLFASQARLGPDFLAGARAQRLRNRAHALAHTLRGMGTGAMPPLWDRLDEVRVPVLLVHGALDGKFAALAHDMATRLPDARVLAVPDAGHAVHVEAPAALAAAVRGFLRQVDPPRGGM